MQIRVYQFGSSQHILEDQIFFRVPTIENAVPEQNLTPTVPAEDIDSLSESQPEIEEEPPAAQQRAAPVVRNEQGELVWTQLRIREYWDSTDPIELSESDSDHSTQPY